MTLEERFLRSLAARAAVPQALWWAMAAERVLGHQRPLVVPSRFENICGIGIVHRPHQLFALGDVVIAQYFSGSAERLRFDGYSTKKSAPIGHHRLRYARHSSGYTSIHFTREHVVPLWQMRLRDEVPSRQHRDSGTVNLLCIPSESPDHLRSLSACDPTVRAYVLETLRPGDVAGRVGASSPAYFRGAVL